MESSVQSQLTLRCTTRDWERTQANEERVYDYSTQISLLVLVLRQCFPTCVKYFMLPWDQRLMRFQAFCRQ